MHSSGEALVFILKIEIKLTFRKTKKGKQMKRKGIFRDFLGEGLSFSISGEDYMQKRPDLTRLDTNVNFHDAEILVASHLVLQASLTRS